MLKMIALVVLLAAAVSAGPVAERKFNEFRSLPPLPGRIINGTKTTIKEHPHQISLHLPGRGHMCGGSIISRYWVLTAAHCMDTYRASDYVVIAGMTNLLEGGSRHTIEKYIVHEEFDVKHNGVVSNDIALVKVVEPFIFDSKHRAVPLFHAYEEARTGFASVVTGWGWTGYVYPDILQMVVLPIISKPKCNELFNYLGGMPEGQICAGFDEGGKDSCAGDSGGPLTINGRLAGVVSWGHGCAEPRRPGVYTEVASYRNWIRMNSGV